MNFIFISDLHLTVKKPQIFASFVTFLQRFARQTSGLFILGDLSDAWVGDDDDAPFTQNLIAALAEFSQTAPLFVMQGNRDFLLGETFCQKTGATFLADPTRITLFNESVLLLHGDSLCTRDYQYMMVRRYLRKPQIQKYLLSHSLEERRALALEFRKQGMESVSNKAEDIMDVTPSVVMSTMREFNVTTMVHGHTHRPYIHRLRNGSWRGRRIVLGDWHNYGWYLRWDRFGPALNRFIINDKAATSTLQFSGPRGKIKRHYPTLKL